MSIDCGEAQQLLDAGVRPGAESTRHVGLGFHLARCSVCRAYRDQIDLALLGDLLATPPEPLSQHRRRTLQQRPWFSAIILVATVLVLGILLLIVGQVAFAAYTIQQNVAAMQITVPAQTTVTPILHVPTSAPVLLAAVRPSPSPIPTRLPAVGPTAPTGAEPPSPIPPTIGPPLAFVPSPTPIHLPSIIGYESARLPTLMPTAPIIPVTAKAINVLLLGSDRRPGETWTTRSDAVVVLHLDADRERVAMLSLPRDLVVPIPGYGYDRINAATVYGDLDPLSGGGVALARRTVSEYLGIPIDYVFRADFHAFTAAVDAIGGVEIDVAEALYDSAYPTMDYGFMQVAFAPGLQHMDGSTALIYARLRHSDSSYARNRRQQQVLLAILNQVREQNILAQVQMISDLTTALRDDIQTDMSLERMLGLAWAFYRISPDAVERYALDETMVEEGVLADDPYATFADPGTVRSLVRQFLDGATR